MTAGDDTFKVVRVGPQAACTVEGHLDEVWRHADGTDEKLFLVGKGIADLWAKNPVENLQKSFQQRMENVRSTLRAANDWRVHVGGDGLIRSDLKSEADRQNYRLPNNRFYVTGIICAGISAGHVTIKAAHISTDLAASDGDLRAEEELADRHVAQGDDAAYTSLFMKGVWPQFADGSRPEPPWPAVHAAVQHLRASMRASHAHGSVRIPTINSFAVSIGALSPRLMPLFALPSGTC